MKTYYRIIDVDKNDIVAQNIDDYAELERLLALYKQDYPNTEFTVELYTRKD